MFSQLFNDHMMIKNNIALQCIIKNNPDNIYLSVLQCIDTGFVFLIFFWKYKNTLAHKRYSIRLSILIEFFVDVRSGTRTHDFWNTEPLHLLSLTHCHHGHIMKIYNTYILTISRITIQSSISCMIIAGPCINWYLAWAWWELFDGPFCGHRQFYRGYLMASWSKLHCR